MADDPNLALMSKIRSSAGALISAVAQTSSITPAFLAALIANESSGNPNASRYEASIFQRLQDVVAGRRADFEVRGMKRPLGGQDLMLFIDPQSFDPRGPETGDFSLKLKRLEFLATSWGLTQIMGFHALEFNQPTTKLTDPRGNLEFAVLLLAWFAAKYSLDLQNDVDELFHCWNTGDPQAPTYNPNYVPNGKERMKIYQQILDSEAETT